MGCSQKNDLIQLMFTFILPVIIKMTLMVFIKYLFSVWFRFKQHF